MVSLTRSRRDLREKPELKVAETPKTFRDLVIETARMVALNGVRNTVPLEQSGYSEMFTQAKAIVVWRNHHYSLKEQSIFREAAQAIISEIPRFRSFVVYTNPSRTETGGVQIKLYLRPRN